MFCMFLFIQIIYAIRGMQNKDMMMALGMCASAIANITVMLLVLTYR